VIACVIFDFGDTLALSSEARKEIDFVELGWQIFQKNGFTGKKENYLEARTNANKIYKKMGSEKYTDGFFYSLIAKEANWQIPFEICKKMDKEYYSEYIKNVKLDPYSIPILKYLKSQNIMMIILSNGHKKNVIPILEKNKIKNFFKEIIISFDKKSEKSELHSFKEILSKYALNPEDVIMVGDRDDEDMFAKRLGINTVKIKRPFDHTIGYRLQSDYTINSLIELKKIIQNINSGEQK
jgi:HAD superfamily hydrolase (TIGR01549 family)